MSKAGIVAAIESNVGASQYSSWRIGLTHDLSERKGYWRDDMGENVAHWHQWEADSLSDAQDIEAYFIRLGMSGGTGGDLSSRKTAYVYIF